MLTEDLPTEEQISNAAADRRNCVGNGMYRSVYQIPGTKWVVKIDWNDDNKANTREYNNYLKLKPSLTKPSVRLPEMYMVGQYLIAEFIKGARGSEGCWGSPEWINGKAHYVNGCVDPKCEDGPDCWAELTKEVSKVVADLHYENVRVPEKGTVYLIDLGEH